MCSRDRQRLVTRKSPRQSFGARMSRGRPLVKIGRYDLEPDAKTPEQLAAAR
jgi:hypothetical protein